MTSAIANLPEIVPYVVGKFYRVPVVRATVYDWPREFASNWPVLGPWHEDREIIEFPEHHWHVDGRFLDQKQWKFLSGREHCQPEKYGDVHHCFIMVLHEQTGFRATMNPQPVFLGNFLRKCRRAYPQYPNPHPWPKLQEAYKDAEIGPGLVCPHRGAPLQGLTPDADGCVTCPLHGLRWDCKTGKLAAAKGST